MKSNILFLLSFLVLLGACNQEVENSGEEGSLIVAEGQDNAEFEAKLEKERLAEEEKLKAEAEKVTSMSVDKDLHEFGKVKANSDNGTTFKITNTGQKPLIISDVKASCGCTTPKKPENPILPGKSDVIEVNFHPSSGQGEVKKAITITANTDPKITEVFITASVVD